MSVASDYAAGIATTSIPPSWNGLLLKASVNPDGSCHLIVPSTGSIYDIPASTILAFKDWIVATFV